MLSRLINQVSIMLPDPIDTAAFDAPTMKPVLSWHRTRLPALQSTELYALLKLRAQVFVVEQRSIYLDPDDVDLDAMHLRGVDAAGNLLAYARCIAAGIKYDVASIGRVVTAPSVRGLGLGHALVREAILCTHEAFGVGAIRISAQAHLLDFYRQHGFIADGEEYLEDEMPHRSMQRLP